MKNKNNKKKQTFFWHRWPNINTSFTNISFLRSHNIKFWKKIQKIKITHSIQNTNWQKKLSKMEHKEKKILFNKYSKKVWHFQKQISKQRSNLLFSWSSNSRRNRTYAFLLDTAQIQEKRTNHSRTNVSENQNDFKNFKEKARNAKIKTFNKKFHSKTYSENLLASTPSKNLTLCSHKRSPLLFESEHLKKNQQLSQQKIQMFEKIWKTLTKIRFHSLMRFFPSTFILFRWFFRLENIWPIQRIPENTIQDHTKQNQNEGNTNFSYHKKFIKKLTEKVDKQSDVHPTNQNFDSELHNTGQNTDNFVSYPPSENNLLVGIPSSQ